MKSEPKNTPRMGRYDPELDRLEAADKPILCVAFDGVINSYTSGWQGSADVLPDPPVEGAFEFLAEASQQFAVCVWSTRTRIGSGRYAMRRWFKRHHWPCTGGGKPEGLYFPIHKPACFLTLDDKSFLFTGAFPRPADLTKFRSYREGKQPSCV